MRDNFREFSVTDPFGRNWDVEFRWLQNAISIRHADTVDCKYYISNGEEKREAVIALPHPVLVDVARKHGRDLTDSWCIRLAGLHLERMISTWEDMEKPIVTPHAADVESHNAALETAVAAARREAELRH